MMSLEDRFARAWSALGGSGDGRELAARLLAAYAEPRRVYHTVAHLEACLALLDSVSGQAEHPAEVEMALFFHDAVYDPLRTDNEARSAAWARAALEAGGIGAPIVSRVTGIVLATAHKDPPSSPDAALAVDIDLSILGAPPGEFDRYEAAVRREYAFVGEHAWRRGRGAVLDSFLRRPSIFRTPALHQRFESTARRNIACSLARLGAGGPGPPLPGRGEPGGQDAPPR